MKYLITFILSLFFLSSFSQTKQWQPIEQADWELFDRLDHKKHMVAGQLSTIYTGLFVTYKDGYDPNIKGGLLVGVSSSLALTIGKEVIWDYYLGYGTATYPDLVYGITGTLVGAVFTYAIYRFDRWYVKKYNINYIFE